ncbi:hypothetical protein [Salinicola sp. DM10]|uniref:hypothetical protein n=1 Tax=Salinicola sp. DM10 TaxID=2815721 RepID=UPI001A905CE3|nr:hypothetical protein [Salinicola sp. DM10]MCE3026877.1 hypothetical protein [Salinicola sp. DM10]
MQAFRVSAPHAFAVTEQPAGRLGRLGFHPMPIDLLDNPPERAHQVRVRIAP